MLASPFLGMSRESFTFHHQTMKSAIVDKYTKIKGVCLYVIP
jgi:hypothetical protein